MTFATLFLTNNFTLLTKHVIVQIHNLNMTINFEAFKTKKKTFKDKIGKVTLIWIVYRLCLRCWFDEVAFIEVELVVSGVEEQGRARAVSGAMMFDRNAVLDVHIGNKYRILVFSLGVDDRVVPEGNKLESLLVSPFKRPNDVHIRDKYRIVRF